MTQQRAVNVVKAFQAWAAADDEDDEGGVDEEVESEMICLSRSLVPILQSVGVGSHWEMIWDLVETSLDSADLSDDTTMTSLARNLRLVIALLDVQATNRVLREAWVGRVDGVLKSVRDLAGIRFEGESGSSKPKSVCRELILEIVRDLPSGLVERDTLPKVRLVAPNYPISLTRSSLDPDVSSPHRLFAVSSEDVIPTSSHSCSETYGRPCY
jgi:hypothetical protein